MSKKSFVAVVIAVGLWLLSFLTSAGLAVYQRLTGPTYPLTGKIAVGPGQELGFKLLRTHGGEGDLPVVVDIGDEDLSGTLIWRRFPTNDSWEEIELTREGAVLVGGVPHQPPAGKVEYQLRLESGVRSWIVPEREAAVARFKGEVPAFVLIPHILAMFGSMLVYTRALFEAFRGEGEHTRLLVLAGTLLLVVGGLMLGPVVQKYAFDAYWTGWPFGTDLTDNKTALLVLAWLPAVWLALKRRPMRAAVVLGWVVMLGVFLIPHSVRGSQIDWEQVEQPAPHSPSEAYPSSDAMLDLQWTPEVPFTEEVARNT